MSPKQRTLAEEMALVILRGDTVAAYALADALLEERDGKVTKMAKAAEALRQEPLASDGYEVYRWPEFRAFCDRAGILWDLRTISMTFTIEEGSRLVVSH
jgi:very-short-patch-repair endonuclease